MDLSEKEYYTGVFFQLLYHIGLLGLGFGFLELLHSEDALYTYTTALCFVGLFLIGKLGLLVYIRYSLQPLQLTTMYIQLLLAVCLGGIFYEFYTTVLIDSYESFYYTIIIYTLFVNHIISYRYVDTGTNKVIFSD